MIELRNINFRYAGGTDAGGLVNIDLIIPDGQVILLCRSEEHTSELSH